MLSMHMSYSRGRSYCMPHQRFMTKMTFCSWLFCPCYDHGKCALFLLFDLIQAIRSHKWQWKIQIYTSVWVLNLLGAVYSSFFARSETIWEYLFDIDCASQNTLIDLQIPITTSATLSTSCHPKLVTRYFLGSWFDTHIYENVVHGTFKAHCQ